MLTAAALGVSALAFSVALESPGAASASPIALDSANDPRVVANCPGGFGPTGGGRTYCRVNGQMLTPTSGVGSRWAGQYATIFDQNGDGISPIGGPYQPDDVIVYFTCGEDAGSHPASTGYTALLPGAAASAALHGSIAHPEALDAYLFSLAGSADNTVATQVPGSTSGVVYSADDWATASWALGKYLVGDRSASGTVAVSNITNAFAGAPSAEALIAELLNTVASNVVLNANYFAAPTASNSDFAVQQSGTLYDGTPFGHTMCAVFVLQVRRSVAAE